MKSFSYVAKDAKGKQIKGTMTAENEQDFQARMREKGLFVSEFKEVEADSKSAYKFSTKELAFNCRQLSSMLTAGLTLVKAIDILTKEQEKEKARLIWQDIYENVQKGESFSECLQQHAGSFPDFLISMVGAGEASGSLDVIMQRMSDHYANENKLHNTIKSAMVYPIILLVLCVVIVIFLFTFIMPTFIDMYDDPSTMPVLTKIMAAISDFLRTKWYILVGVVVVLYFGIRYALKAPNLRVKVDRFILKGPGFGPLVTKVYTGRFARNLSSLYSSGIPMVECLERASSTLGNLYIDQCFEQVIDEVKQGETLSAAITRTEVFETMFCSVLYVGEESGALDSILEKTAEYYEEESDSAIQRLVGMIEPILIIFLGLIIGMVVCAIYPALYGSMESMENG